MLEEGLPGAEPRGGASRPFDAFQATRHFGSLDGLRCFAVIAVLWHHAGPSPLMEPRLLGRGFLAVDLFFALSGFLIVTLLLRERRRTGTISLTAFYIRRTLRIFPPYYGLLLALAAGYTLFMLDDPQAQKFLALLPAYLLYLSNFIPHHAHALFLAPTWSLACEEQFYLVWPAVEKVLRRWWWVVAGAGLATMHALELGVADSLFMAAGFTRPYLYLAVPFRALLLGVLLAHLLHSRTGFHAVYRLVGGRWAPVALSACLLLMLQFMPTDLSGLPYLPVHAMMVLLLASIVVREDHVLRPLLTWAPIRRLGVISYGIYLYHMIPKYIAGVALERVGLYHRLSEFVVMALLTVVMAELSFRFFESPWLKLKDAFVRRTSRPALPQPAPLPRLTA